MKKITKIWVLSLALIALTTALCTKADDPITVTKTVSLILQDWQNTCVAQDYDLWSKQVSPSDQYVGPQTGTITCTILKSPAHHIEIWLEHLTGAADTINANQFTWVISNVQLTWSLANPQTPTFNMATTTTVYPKVENQVWIWTWDLTIDGIIPGWKPAWSYTGTLNVSVVVGLGS